MIDYEQIFKKLLIENQKSLLELNNQKLEEEVIKQETHIEELNLIDNHQNYDDNKLMKAILGHFKTDLAYPADLNYKASDDMPK